MNLEGLISEPKKVVRVSKDKPSQDGFSAVLETEEVVEISNTQWCSTDNVEKAEDGIFFESIRGKVHFTKNILKEVESL